MTQWPCGVRSWGLLAAADDDRSLIDARRIGIRTAWWRFEPDMRAVLNGTVIAESDETVVVEGNHYFPPESVKTEFLQPTSHSTHCRWKGDASYYDITVDGQTQSNAAWYYPEPKEKAVEIKDHVAFYGVVDVS